MTIRIHADHQTDGPVSHKWYPDGQFGVLSFGREGLGNNLYFHDVADIDAVIAELVALRAEMTGDTDDTWRLTPKGEAALDAEAAANPPHHATLTGEKECTAPGWEDKDSGYVCTAQDGHDGDHVAYMPGGGEYHRWPAAEPEPLVISDSTIEQARAFAQPGNTIDDLLAATRGES